MYSSIIRSGDSGTVYSGLHFLIDLIIRFKEMFGKIIFLLVFRNIFGLYKYIFLACQKDTGLENKILLGFFLFGWFFSQDTIQVLRSSTGSQPST